MKRSALVVVGVLAAAVGISAMLVPFVNAQQGVRKQVKPSPLKHTVIHRMDLVGLEGKQGALVEVEYAPGAGDKKHYHSGYLFTYVVEGSVIWEVEGQAPVTLKAGDAFYDPPKRVHNHRNASATQPAKFVAFFIETNGEKRSVPVK